MTDFPRSSPGWGDLVVDRHRRWTAILSLLGLLLLCWLAFFHDLDGLGPVDKTEALQMEIARRMAASGDWTTPVWNGAPYFDKPVWPYWMGAISFRWLGVTPWAARLPAALAASSLVWAVFALLLVLAPRREPGWRRWLRAWFGAALMALNPAWITWGRTAVHDVYLVAAISLALFGFFLGFRSDLPGPLRRLAYGVVPLAAGVGVLAKGPLGIGLPMVTILAYLLLRRRLNLLLRAPWVLLGMVAAFLAVVGPWYTLVIREHGTAFIGHFFGFSNLDRLTSVVDKHGGPVWYYVPVVLLLFLPWSLYLPPSLLPRSRGGAESPTESPEQEPLADLARFSAVWFVVVFALFSVATTKLPGYILPLIPAAVLLVTLAFVPPRAAGDPSPDRGRERGLTVSAVVNLILLAAAAGAAALAPRFLNPDPLFPAFNQAAFAVLGRAAVLLLVALVIALVLLPVARRRVGLGPAPVLAGVNLGLIAALLLDPLPRLRHAFLEHCQRPVQTLARQAAAEARPGEPIYIPGARYYSAVYYGGRPVRFGSPDSDPDNPLRKGTAARPPSSVVVLGSARSIERIPGEHRIELLAEEGNLRVVRLYPPVSGTPGSASSDGPTAAP